MDFIPSMAIILVPLVLLFLFNSNAGVMFFAACAGLVLLGSLDTAVVATAGAVVPGEGEAYVRLSVVLVSIILSSLMFKNKIHGSSLVPHGVIAFLVGVMLWLLLPSVTGVSWLVDSIDNKYWQDVNNFSTLIIAIAFSLSILIVMSRSHTAKGKHKSKH